MKVKLGDVVLMNPTTQLKQGTMAKFVSMDKLESYQKEIDNYEIKEFKSGTKFINGDTLVARITPCLENGKTAFVDFLDDGEVGGGSTEFIVFREKPGVTDKNFIYYLAISPKFRECAIQAMIGTSGRQRVQNDVLAQFEFNLPNLQTQKKIAEILTALDAKIHLNRETNRTLESLATALFQKTFLTNSEKETWGTDTLGDIMTNFDSKRVPLSSRQRLERKGEYRYIGATSVMDYVDDFLFDGTYLLIAEDGSVMKGDGTPYLQYIWGKFWLNNHAHIVQAKPPFSTEYLYILLSQTNIKALVSGAVQLKINQKAMNSLPIVIPPTNILTDFNEKIAPIFAQIRVNDDQSQTLTHLRQTLLPKLISGEIKV